MLLHADITGYGAALESAIDKFVNQHWRSSFYQCWNNIRQWPKNKQCVHVQIAISLISSAL